MRISFPLRVLLVLTLFFCGAAAAAAGTLQGHVRNQSGTAVEGALVLIFDPATGEFIDLADTNASGFYSLTLADGTYDVTVQPPGGSGLGGATAFGVVVSGATTLDFALPALATFTFSGRILDLAGVGIPLQSVQVIRDGTEIGQSAFTDSQGRFSFAVEEGNYLLRAIGDNQGFTAQAPHGYSIQTGAFAIAADADVDFTLPVKRLHVHVQEADGTAVAGAGLSSSSALNCELSFGGQVSCGASSYAFDPSAAANATTDGSGDVTLFLFPTSPAFGTTYSLTATPPGGLGLAPGTLTGVQLLEDSSVTIILGAPTFLRGRLLDGAAAGVPDQTLVLTPEGLEDGFTTTTDAAGGYEFAAAPGSYHMTASGGNQGFTAAAPQSYDIFSGPFAVTANQVTDFTLPVRRVDVHVLSPTGEPVAGVGISTTSVSNCELTFGPAAACGFSSYSYGGAPEGATDESGDVTLWLFPTPLNPDPTLVSSYSFTAFPPAGSGLPVTTVTSIRFTSAASVTITLAAPITLSGVVRDLDNQGMANQFLELQPEFGVGSSVFTDGTGAFSLLTQAGTFRLNLLGDNQDFTAAAPQSYVLGTDPFALSASEALNLVLPVKRLVVHVQDGDGAAIPGVGLSAAGPTTCSLPLGPYTACGSSQYAFVPPPPGSPAIGVTDAAGNLTLYLFPTPPEVPPDPAEGYFISATPPAGSGFDTATAENVTLSDDATLVMVLPGTHAPPVTTLTVTSAVNPDGRYRDPVTIELSAAGAPGFAVDLTAYAVDDGDFQLYIGDPFQVSGTGPHTVRYFSIDVAGVFEDLKVFNFEIAPPDHIAPTTTASVSPSPNGAGWHSSDVTVTLNAVDDPGGTGVFQISYSIAGAQATPLTHVSGDTAAILITTDGESVITFYATDNAGNVEAAQTVTVKLDKTAPEVYSQWVFAAPAPDLWFFPRDSGSGVPAGPLTAVSVVCLQGDPIFGCLSERRTYQVADAAGNTLQVVVDVSDPHRRIDARILTLQYGSAPAIAVAPNQQGFQWKLHQQGALKEVTQRMAGGGSQVTASFNDQTNTTVITRLQPPPVVQETRPGLSLLRMATSQGTLVVEY